MTEAAPSPNTAIPVLPVADLVRSAAWYERLGFTVHGVWDDYVIMEFEGAEVHLVQLADEALGQPSSSGAYLRVVDADALFARWTALGATVVAELTDEAYGIREFATQDLDHNLWRVGAWLPTDPELEPEFAPEPEFEFEPTAPPSPAATPPSNFVSGSAEPGRSAHEVRDGVGEELEEGVGVRTDGGPGTTDDAWFALVSGEAPCAGCGMLPQDIHVRGLGAEVRDVAHAFGEVLAQADDDLVRRRPAPQTWSALEYGVHVRDVLTVFAERVIRALAETEPQLGWWDHEAAIADGMANESDVGAVVDDLGRNAGKLSEALRMVTEDDWERGATRRPDERFTIELMARFALHEVRHHKADAEAALAAASAR